MRKFGLDDYQCLCASCISKTGSIVAVVGLTSVVEQQSDSWRLSFGPIIGLECVSVDNRLC